jgi:MoxR-like ATPase
MNEPAAPDFAAQALRAAGAIRSEVAKALIGQGEIIDQVLIALLSGGHVLVEGVPGLGKTLLVRALAKTFDGRFARIQFTPDLMPADVTGHTLYDQATREFTTRKGPVFANLLLADEINRAPAKTQAALLEVMQEGQVTIEGTPHPLQPPFMVLATQNPIEQEGTYALPEAQLDRFLLKIRIDFPSQEDEHTMVRQVTANQVGDRLNVDSVATIIKPQAVLALQRFVASLTVDERVSDYAVRITRATRNWPGVTAGASPRGGIALVRAARAHALINGRDFVTPDDVKAVALPALRHRMTLAPELEIEGQSTDALLGALLNKVEAPRT